MANVSHASLTGAELHEPKGADGANLGEVYVADGNGSGNWANVGTSSFTGMIADFTWPVVQNGWLELDGSDVSTTTYAALYSVMTIQASGTRSNGSNIITSLPSTTQMRVGYYVYGTGIASGTTVLSINSGSQITLSNAASSSGTSVIAISPWLLNLGTIRLPDLSTAGRYRRSRTSTTAVGQLQADQNQAHTHSVSGTTGGESNDHNHAVAGTSGNMNANQSHSHTVGGAAIYGGTAIGGATGGGGISVDLNPATISIGSANIDHTHPINLTSAGRSQQHTHTFTTTSASSGATETRPLSIVVMTCVKT